LKGGGMHLGFEIDTGRRLATSAVISQSLNLVILSSIFQITLGIDLRISLCLQNNYKCQNTTINKAITKAKQISLHFQVEPSPSPWPPSGHT
jgi:hypothetical protein